MNIITLPVRQQWQIPQLVIGQEEGISNREEESQKSKSKSQKSKVEDFSLAPSTQHPTPLLVGRDTELVHLHRLLDNAMHGERQLVFVTGEPGIGKTTLVDTFLAQICERDDLRITSGQCVEQYGPGEPYMPLLEAIGRLCQGPRRERRIADLERYAPSLLVQLPGLLDPAAHARLQDRVQGMSRERMLREMAQAAELFTARRGLVLVLEDLHWSDGATLEWLSYIARRREPAKLMIVGTYRPLEMLATGSPTRGVVQELSGRALCSEVRVTPLAASLVQEYVTRRCGGTVPPIEFATSIHQRTEGNPLFVRTVVEYLLAHGGICESDGQWHFQADGDEITTCVPQTLRQLIEQQVERASPEVQQLLAVASVVGVEFTVAEVAAGLQGDAETLELQCERLAQTRQFLRMEGVAEWPDGTLSGRYSFVHAVYREVIDAQVSGMRRVQWHRRVTERKAAAYGERVREIAAELAVHCERGREYAKAVHYHRQAAEAAVRASAAREAVSHLQRGLELLRQLPDHPDHVQQELLMQLTLGEQLTSLSGFGVEEVERAFSRARELCCQLGETPQLFRVVLGLWAFYVERAQLATARELAEQLLRLAQHVQKLPPLFVWAHLSLGITLHFAGDQASARQHLEECVSLYDPQHFRSSGASYDPAVLGYATLGPVLWLLGYPEQAREHSQQGLALAQTLSQPYSVVYAASLVTRTHLLRGELQAVHEHIEELVAECQEHGFASYLALSRVVQGWLQAEQGEQEAGIAQMHKELATWRATGAESARPYYLALLAETYGKVQDADTGLTVLSECWPWMDTTGGRVFEAELYRLRGELMLQQLSVISCQLSVSDPCPPTPDPQGEAKACFQRAIEIAHRQETKSLELRAAISLARLWQQQDKVGEARDLLQEIYDWFTEGFDTKDLQEAEVLLVSLGGTTENAKCKMQNAKSRETEGVTSKTEGASSFSPYSLQPIAYSLPQSSVLSPQSLPSPTSNLQPPTSNVFRPEGDYWTLAYEGQVCRLRDMRGLHYLAYLLQHPNDDIHAFRLVTGDEASADASHSGARLSMTEGFSLDTSDSGEMLDAQARAAYKQRISDLQAELDEAMSFHDQGRSDALREELEFLTDELAQAVGLGGRARRLGSPVERARTAVTRAIKNALKKICEHHTPLGQYLTHTIKTGTFCTYTPDPRSLVSWQF